MNVVEDISLFVNRGRLAHLIASVSQGAPCPPLSKTDRQMLWAFRDRNLELLVRYLPHSRSQLRQDLFVLIQTGFKRDGYFVEFGATNGVDLSNTHLLENHFGWHGILAEPARCWHGSLQANRPGSSIDNRCVWKETGASLSFVETKFPELSTIQDFAGTDKHRKGRLHGTHYEVPTISLEQLLSDHHAPPHIDYLSMDTEGSEFEILSNFDFSKYRIDIITCEHNFSKNRQKIFDLLSAHGYRRIAPHVSRIDDWYILNKT